MRLFLPKHAPLLPPLRATYCSSPCGSGEASFIVVLSCLHGRETPSSVWFDRPYNFVYKNKDTEFNLKDASAPCRREGVGVITVGTFCAPFPNSKATPPPCSHASQHHASRRKQKTQVAITCFRLSLLSSALKLCHTYVIICCLFPTCITSFSSRSPFSKYCRFRKLMVVILVAPV